MPRIAVVDIGTNSTRLLIADVTRDGVTELERRSIVTRLGEGLEATGELGDEPRARVLRALDEYAAAITARGADARTAVLTSAVRDAANGAAFTATVRERYGLDAETISGDEEARLTFLGATAARPAGDDMPLLVVDIGGGSTELVAGRGGAVGFHVSTPVGVVRHSERHLHHDPPRPGELEALAADARATIEAATPDGLRDGDREVIAVAGTATMAAAMDLALEPYDSARVEGHTLTLDALRGQLGRLAALPLAERARTPGLHPDRAPTIVAGLAVLVVVLEAFAASAVRISDRDILWGRAIDAASKTA